MIDPDPKAHHSGQAALLVWSLIACGAAFYTLQSSRHGEVLVPVVFSCLGIALSFLARPRGARLGLRLLYLTAVCFNLLVGAVLYAVLYRMA